MIRRKHLFLLALMFGTATASLFAQFGDPQARPMQIETPPKFELSAQYGYSFGAIVYTNSGDVTLEPGAWYGGAVDFFLKRDIMLELSYYYRTSDLTRRGGSAWEPGLETKLGEQTTNYLQVGSIKTFRKGKVAPFLGGNIGLGWFSSDIPGSSTSTFFTVSGLGGAKIYLTEHFGLRLQGRLILPIFFGSVGFYCGGGGCGAGVGGSGTVEGELSGGLFLSF